MVASVLDRNGGTCGDGELAHSRHLVVRRLLGADAAFTVLRDQDGAAGLQYSSPRRFHA